MTRQIRDILIYNGNEFELNEELLEGYFKEFPEKRPESEMVMTALWRGYIAVFEIKENQLFINQLKIFTDTKLNLKTLNNLFPNNNKFEWFSGLIRIDDFRGEYDDENDINAVYEILEIKRGNLLNHWKLNHEDFISFKNILFDDFKKTNNYEKLYSRWKNNNPTMDDSKIDVYIYDYIIRNVREI